MPLPAVRVSWFVLFELLQIGKAIKDHVDEQLTAKERRRVAEILRTTKGDPRKLSSREKDDLREIARHLDVAKLARDIGPRVVRGRRARKR